MLGETLFFKEPSKTVAWLKTLVIYQLQHDVHSSTW
jgi:hypothetical protein